jgi:hypothetical protein
VAALRAATVPDTMAGLLKDEQAVVRLAAAEALLRKGENPVAWEVIHRGIKEASNATERLFAVNVAARVPSGPIAALKPTLQAIMAAPAPKAGGENYTARAVEDLLAQYK